MGGAFVAISDDANALFYNPAGLTDVPENKISPFTLEMEVGEGAYDEFAEALRVDTGDLQQTADFLRDHIGDYARIAAAVFPHYERPNFAFGIFGTERLSLYARNFQDPRLIVNSIQDTGIAAGYAHSLMDDRISLGASAKFLMRKSFAREYTLTDMTYSGFKSDLREGLWDDADDGNGVLLDLGGIYKFEDVKLRDKKMSFQAGISINNLIGASLGNAQNLNSHADIGFSAKMNPWTFAFDIVDVTNNIDKDEDIPKRIRLGVEYIYQDYLTLRTGLYQGYTTFGIGLSGKHVQLDLLTYAEEIGTYSGQQKDRRYTLGLAFCF